MTASEALKKNPINLSHFLYMSHKYNGKALFAEGKPKSKSSLLGGNKQQCKSRELNISEVQGVDDSLTN